MSTYAIHHINGKPRDNDIHNLAVVDISENLGGNTMKNLICKCGLKVTKSIGDIYIEDGKEFQDTTIACPGCKTIKIIKKRGNTKGLLID